MASNIKTFEERKTTIVILKKLQTIVYSLARGCLENYMVDIIQNCCHKIVKPILNSMLLSTVQTFCFIMAPSGVAFKQ